MVLTSIRTKIHKTVAVSKEVFRKKKWFIRDVQDWIMVTKHETSIEANPILSQEHTECESFT